MKSTIKLISGAAILLASLSGQAIAQETIKVGMSGKYFPFTFVKQDKLQGFEVDMWNQIGERTGYKVEFVTASFSGLFGMLETGRVDTISNQITITDERKAKYAFSQPYVYTYDSAFEQDVALGRIDAFVMDRVSTAQLIKESKLPLQQAGAPFETIENALPFLKTPEKQAVLKKVDDALTAMRKDGTLTKISEKWFAADITSK